MGSIGEGGILGLLLVILFPSNETNVYIYIYIYSGTTGMVVVTALTMMDVGCWLLVL